MLAIDKHVRMSEKQHRKIVRLAKKWKCTEQEVVRRLIDSAE